MKIVVVVVVVGVVVEVMLNPNTTKNQCTICKDCDNQAFDAIRGMVHAPKHAFIIRNVPFVQAVSNQAFDAIRGMVHAPMLAFIHTDSTVRTNKVHTLILRHYVCTGCKALNKALWSTGNKSKRRRKTHREALCNNYFDRFCCLKKSLSVTVSEDDILFD